MRAISRRSRSAVWVALASALLFGAAPPASKVLLASFTPFQLAGLLYLGAAAAMTPIAVRSGELRTRLDRRNRVRLAGAVLLGGVVAPVLILSALRIAPAASVALWLNLEVASTAVLGTLVFSDSLTNAGWLGATGVAVAGMLLTGGNPLYVQGGVLVAIACVCWALDNHYTALIDAVTPPTITWWKGVVAGSVNLAIGLATTAWSAHLNEIATALLIGALSYGVSIALYIHAAQRLGAVRAQAIFAVAPFVGALLSFVALGEPLTLRTAAAAALLMGSIAFLLAGTHAHTHAHGAMEHVHSHRHDDGHHDHAHDGPTPLRHSHWHAHPTTVHSHGHRPDLHHRHDHE